MVYILLVYSSLGVGPYLTQTTEVYPTKIACETKASKEMSRNEVVLTHCIKAFKPRATR